MQTQPCKLEAVPTVDRLINQTDTIEFHANGLCGWVSRAVAGEGGLAVDKASLLAWVEALTGGGVQPQRVWKDDDRSRVATVQLDGQPWIVKQYRMWPWKAWLYHRLRSTPAWREWWGAWRLAAAGCRVSRPAALVYETRSGHGTQWLVLPCVEGLSLYHWLARSRQPDEQTNNTPVQHRRLARAIGRQIGHITAAGIINRDLKPSNLIVDAACERDARPPVIIDPAGLRRRRSDKQVCQMLAAFLQATQEPGPVTRREAMACLAGVLESDPSIARDSHRRLKTVALRVLSLLRCPYPWKP